MEELNIAVPRLDTEPLVVAAPGGVATREAKKGVAARAKSKNRTAYLCAKRLLDIVASLLGGLLFCPFALLLALLIKLDSKGPVFYRHKRVGKGGKPIYILKFRSMVAGADKMIDTFTPQQKKEFEENYKLENDPRITRVGRFLRRTSIDEFPQFINILIGDLSLVGPRPVVEKELEKYGSLKEKLLSVKPGAAGYWQANGRSATTYEERIQMELYYVDHASLWFDIKALLFTFVAVIKRHGAV